ncbi:MAG TPA: hypothetical protein PKY46_02960 [Ignavibacteriaceae bacterium]|nr:hypothetical protein [Ignavibacteriaceae bacterium]
MAENNFKHIQEKIVYTFVAGLIWGLLEITLSALTGSLLLFSRGIVFSFFAVLVLLFGKRFVPYKLSLILVALLTIIIKSASSGISVNYIIAIFSEALIAEGILYFLGQSKISAMFLGGILFLYTFIHGLLFHGTLPNTYIEYIYKGMLAGLTGIETTSPVLSYFVFAVLVVVAGIFSGYILWLFTEKYAEKTNSEIRSFLNES